MRITLSAGSRMPPRSKLDPVKHEGLRARWGLVASDRYALQTDCSTGTARGGADAPRRARTARGFRSVHPCAAGALSTLQWRWLGDRSRSRRRCTTPSDVAGPLAVAKKADTRRRRSSRITSYVHQRRSRCSARGPTTAPFAPFSLRLRLRLRLRLECACARGPKRHPSSGKLLP